MYIVFVFFALFSYIYVFLSPAAVLCAHEHACVTVHMYIAETYLIMCVCVCVRVG